MPASTEPDRLAIRVGATWLVPTRGLLAALGLPVPARSDDKIER